LLFYNIDQAEQLSEKLSSLSQHKDTLAKNSSAVNAALLKIRSLLTP
jgi:hypothetical protein